jgi:hypothetical protein
MEDLDAFRSEVWTLHESFRELETSIEGARLQSIDKTVRAACRLTRDGVSLQDRFQFKNHTSCEQQLYMLKWLPINVNPIRECYPLNG